jgi:hypothetical protein
MPDNKKYKVLLVTPETGERLFFSQNNIAGSIEYLNSHPDDVGHGLDPEITAELDTVSTVEEAIRKSAMPDCAMVMLLNVPDNPQRLAFIQRLRENNISVLVAEDGAERIIHDPRTGALVETGDGGRLCYSERERGPLINQMPADDLFNSDDAGVEAATEIMIHIGMGVNLYQASAGLNKG